MNSASTSRLTRGYAIAFVGTIIWSSTAVFVRYLTEAYRMPPVVLAFWRDFIVFCLFVLPMFFLRPALLRVKRSRLLYLAFYGFVLSLFNTSWTTSVAYNGAAVSTVMAYSSAAITAIAGWRLFKERLDLLKLLAVLVSLVGCAFVSGAYDPAAWRLNPIGIITGLLSGVAFAAYSLMGRYASQTGIHPLTVLVYTFGIAAFFLLVFNLLPFSGSSHPANLLWLGQSWLGWGVLFLLALVPTIGGYGLYTLSLSYLPAGLANLIATTEPVYTSIQSYLLIQERMTPPQILGSVVILVSVLFIRWYEGKLANSQELVMEQSQAKI